MKPELSLEEKEAYSKTTHYAVVVDGATTDLTAVHFRTPVPGHWVLKGYPDFGPFQSREELVEALGAKIVAAKNRPHQGFVPTR